MRNLGTLLLRQHTALSFGGYPCSQERLPQCTARSSSTRSLRRLGISCIFQLEGVDVLVTKSAVANGRQANILSGLRAYSGAITVSALMEALSCLYDRKSLVKMMLTVPLKSMVLWESAKKDGEGLAAVLIAAVIRENNVLLHLRYS
jgi:hypothetical protein